jgi:hypothetical protein
VQETVTNGRKVSDILTAFTEASRGERLRLGELVEAFGDRAFGMLTLILSLPNAVGLGAIPGLSTVFGLPQLFIALQMAFGRHRLWLPSWVLERSIARSDFASVLGKAMPHLLRAERTVAPRLLLLSSSAAERLLGILFVVLATIVSLPIPFGNQVPAIAQAIISIGLVERDGRFICLGLVVSVIAMAIVTAVITAGAAALVILIQNIFG